MSVRKFACYSCDRVYPDWITTGWGCPVGVCGAFCAHCPDCGALGTELFPQPPFMRDAAKQLTQGG